MCQQVNIPTSDSMNRNEAVAVLSSAARRMCVESHLAAVNALVRERVEIPMVKESIRSRIPECDAESLVKFLKPISRMAPNDQLGMAADVFTQLLDRADDLSRTDAIRLITIRANMRIYDSELFDRIGSDLRIEGIDELRQVVGSLVKLKHSLRDSTCIVDYVLRNRIGDADLTTVVVPVLQYVTRSAASIESGCVDEIVSTVMDSVHAKLELLRADPDLLKYRAVLSVDDGYKIVTSLAQVSRVASEWSLTPAEKADVQFILSKVLMYELRNLPLNHLLKLFFSVGQLDLFDDFFIRRRLVPAIANIYTKSAVRTPKEATLVLTMISQLPFSNALVADLIQLAGTEAKRLPRGSQYYDAANDLVSRISKFNSDP